MPLVSGASFGVFEDVTPLGAGGMGEVWRARDPRLEREVALKVLPSSAEADDGARKRLLREARMASKLNHPNVCTIYEIGEAEGRAFIAMELVEGPSLAEKLASGALPPETVMRYGEQVAGALDHAHSRGVVHRDLKCANVVITPEGRAKVLDFGLAGRLRSDDLEASTQSMDSAEISGKIAGTLPYMAPEQLRGMPADARSDLWALGIMLYEMAAGSRPFQGNTGFELSSAILGEPTPPLPPTETGQLPAQLQAVIDHCLEKDPDARYQAASEVRAALEMTRTGSRVRLPSRRRAAGGNRRLLLAATGIAVVVAGLMWLGIGGARDRLLGGGSVEQRRIRLAVLPFANLSGDPEQSYLSDGFTQEMITQLGKLHPDGLSVIARSSVMRYRDGAVPIDQIGRELEVDYVLEGSAQREGDRIRVATELIDVADQSQLWSDAYERELSGMLVVQSEVAREVAKALALQLVPEEVQRLASAGGVDSAAYEAYLKGTMYWQSMTPEGIDLAERHFEQAIKEDPSYTPAYAGLAIVWAGRQQMGLVPPGEAGPKAKAAAERAIALDADSDTAHAALAIVSTWTDWAWETADREWRRALEINPNSANAHAYYAHFLAIVGRSDEAVEHAERSIELDPYNPLFRSLYGVVLLVDRRLDEAMDAARASLELQPGIPLAENVLQEAYIAKGMREEQLEHQRQRIARDPERVAAFERGLAEGGYEGAQLAIADLLAERYEGANGVPAEYGARPVFPAITIAWRYIDGGDVQRAIDWLEEAYEARDPNLPYLGLPLFDPLRSDPRFQALASRMNLPNVTSVATSYQQ